MVVVELCTTSARGIGCVKKKKYIYIVLVEASRVDHGGNKRLGICMYTVSQASGERKRAAFDSWLESQTRGRRSAPRPRQRKEIQTPNANSEIFSLWLKTDGKVALAECFALFFGFDKILKTFSNNVLSVSPTPYRLRT